MVIEKRMSQLVEDQSGEHVPGDLIAAPFARDVAALDLDDLGRVGVHSRDARPQHDAVVPIRDPTHHQEAARPRQRPRDQIASGGVLAAPRADVHPVVDTLVAMGADVLEALVPPHLLPPAPRAHSMGYITPPPQPQSQRRRT